MIAMGRCNTDKGAMPSLHRVWCGTHPRWTRDSATQTHPSPRLARVDLVGEPLGKHGCLVPHANLARGRRVVENFSTSPLVGRRTSQSPSVRNDRGARTTGALASQRS